MVKSACHRREFSLHNLVNGATKRIIASQTNGQPLATSEDAAFIIDLICALDVTLVEAIGPKWKDWLDSTDGAAAEMEQLKCGE